MAVRWSADCEEKIFSLWDELIKDQENARELKMGVMISLCQCASCKKSDNPYLLESFLFRREGMRGRVILEFDKPHRAARNAVRESLKIGLEKLLEGNFESQKINVPTRAGHSA